VAWHDPPVTLVFVLTGIAILGVVAMVASGSGDGLEPAVSDRPGPWTPSGRPVGGDDLRRIRFGLALRGYRMGEVDRLLERLAEEVSLRDALIDELETQRAAQPQANPLSDG
jgi:DivIVA domain-containing protein